MAKRYRVKYGLLQVPVEELQPGMVIDVWWLAGRDMRERIVLEPGTPVASHPGSRYTTIRLMMADGQELRNYDSRRLSEGTLIPVWPEGTETSRQGLELVRKLRVEPGT